MTDQNQLLDKDELAARSAANIRIAIILALAVVGVYAGYIFYNYL